MKLHFLSLIPISTVGTSHLSAVNIIGAFEFFLKDLEIPLRNANLHVWTLPTIILSKTT